MIGSEEEEGRSPSDLGPSPLGHAYKERGQGVGTRSKAHNKGIKGWTGVSLAARWSALRAGRLSSGHLGPEKQFVID
ncbi:hypothetical protein Trydic_g11238 [Trypoxylus dichotomus]